MKGLKQPLADEPLCTGPAPGRERAPESVWNQGLACLVAGALPQDPRNAAASPIERSSVAPKEDQLKRDAQAAVRAKSLSDARCPGPADPKRLLDVDARERPGSSGSHEAQMEWRHAFRFSAAMYISQTSFTADAGVDTEWSGYARFVEWCDSA